MTRANASADRRKAWHEAEIDRAPTPKSRLWKVCGWLVAEAWRRGRVDEAEKTVMEKIRELRGETRDEEVRDDRIRY